MTDHSQFQKPSEYMRNRRPELFSDSKEIEKKSLPKNMLEYELDNITSKSKEKNFEYFCRKICEKEIAPNLIPQTGPTGGGDSKADTETYPVADEIAQTWLTYEALNSSSERWAFAFSAQKTWKPKVKSDVKKLLETNRGYRRIYFISNQFVKDKDRAEFEDELSKLYSTSVHILSREWLVERVYTNNHVDIAISTLDIQGYSFTSNKELGVKDYERTKELEVLENSIKDITRYVGVEWQLADDCLRAAELIRALEKPKDEVINAFQRAKRIAENHRLDYQLFKINYHLAWTHLFWFDDIKEVIKIYPAIENYCETSNQIDDTERLNNLFNLIQGQFQQGLVTEQESGVSFKKDFLLRRLSDFMQMNDRPATSLYAKAIFTNLNLILSGKEESIKNAIEEYLSILKKSEGLIDFPLGRTLSLLKEMSFVFERADNYEQLFDRTIEITQKLESDIAAGRLIFDRAKNSVLDNQYNEAIRLFGKSIIFFAKDECLNEFTLSLYGIAHSYEQQGLLWAARNSYIVAIERSLSLYWTQRIILSRLPWLIKNLIRLEIQIGRPIHVMHWKELLGVIASNAQLSDEDSKEFNNDLNMQDVINAILILKTPFSKISSLVALPDLYDTLDMPFSRVASLYALGQLDVIRSDKFILEDSVADEKLDDYISLWRKQPASRQIADQPSYEDTNLINLRSRLLSVDLNIFCKNDVSIITLGEIIFGVLESMWATAIEEGIYPHKESFNIYIEEVHNLVEGILQTRSEVRNGETSLVIEYHDLNLSSFSTIDDRHRLKEKVFDAVVMIFSHIAYASDIQTKIEKVFGKENANSRALVFSDFYIAISSIFGKEHSFTTDRWLKTSGKIKKYELLRKTPLNEVEILPLKREEGSDESQSGPPEEFLRPEKAKHGFQKINSLIDLNLWDKAKWNGTGFMLSPVLPPQFPPILMLVFDDYEKGKSIFAGIKNRVGSFDSVGKIRLVIVKGIDRKNPNAYSVIFGSNINDTKDGLNSFLTISRINRMYPQNSTNLDNFERAYIAAKVCLLAPCSATKLSPEQQYTIQLKEVIIKNAWEIGENDMDIVGLPDDCDPLIPAGIKDPPIFKSTRYRKR